MFRFFSPISTFALGAAAFAFGLGVPTPLPVSASDVSPTSDAPLAPDAAPANPANPTNPANPAHSNFSRTIRAEWFDRGNVVRGGLPYSDAAVCLCTGGRPDTFVEYDVAFPSAGEYELWAFYASNESRPMRFVFDGAEVGTVFKTAFDSWQTSRARWEKQLDFSVAAPGVKTLRFDTKTVHIPHVCALKFVPKFKPNAADAAAFWGEPRQIAKSEIAKTTGWTPTPWSGGWYLDYARDRALKGESGAKFDAHFALETTVALVPASRLSATVVDPVAEKAAEIAKVNPCDELTYRPGMFALQTPSLDADSDAATQAEARSLAVLVEIAPETPSADGQIAQNNQTAQNAPTFATLPTSRRFDWSLAKRRDLLARTRAALDRFREETGEDDYLRGAEKRLVAFEAADSEIAAAFAVPELSADAARRIAADFLGAVRLYAFVGRANPLVDFDRVLYVLRDAGNLGFAQNYESHEAVPRNFDDKLRVLALPTVDADADPLSADADAALPTSTTLFAPDYPTFLGDLCLHFDAEKALFSSLTRDGVYNVFELDLTAAEKGAPTDEAFREILPRFPDAESYDACYLPDGGVVFTSNAGYAAVPCMQGTRRVANLYRKNADGSIRRLAFDQEHNWFPTLLPNGQLLYLRWEYTDIPHVAGRRLFTANPDGTQQKAFYGSNGFWPVSANYAEPIPGSTTKFVAVVSGHHGVPRFGELVLFDAQRGRVDQKGAVERVCGYPKKIESRTDEKYYSTLHGDNIVDESWPRYMAPVPLSEDYFLVSAQPNADAPWGLYLVDRFDNMIALAETADFACFEPVPWRATEAPPVVLDRVDPSADEATVYVADVYFGDGLKGVPRGTAKSFRVFSYNYAYPEIGGMNAIVGVDGPWDVRQILGTVPIAEDGSALFKIPANTPIALQPLDENGVALQQMRSWFVGQLGEFVSCVGCHEDQDATNPIDLTAFQSGKEPDEIAPWRGPTRGFSFEREVQPVLDRYCVACHDGADSGWGVVPFDLRGGKIVDDYRTAFIGGQPNVGNFSTSYINLARYVRRPGLESDARLLEPAEFSARATELFQILRDDHYGLVLDADAWDILISWIDMNAPYHGTWSEYAGMERVEKWNKNRVALQKLYANVVDDSETARGERYDGAVSAGRLETGWSKIPFSPFASAETKRLIADVAAGKRQFPDGSELRAAFEKRFATDAAYAAKIRELWTGRPGSEGCESPNRAEWSRVAAKRPEHDLLISSTRTSSNELAWAADTGAKYVEPERSRYFASKRSADFQALALAKLSERRRSPDALRRIDLAPNVPLYLTKIPATPNAEKADAKSADAPQTAGAEEVAATDGGKAFWIGTFEITNEQLEVFNPAHDARVESRLGLSHGIRGFYVNSPLLPACRVSWTDAVAFCDWLSEKTGKRFRLPTAAEWERAARAGTTTPTSFGPLDADFSRDANLADQMLIEFIIDQYYHERVPAAASYYDDWIPKSRAFCDGGFLSEIPGSYRPNPFGLFDMFGNVAEWTADVAAPDFGVPLLDSQPSERVVCGGSWRDRPYRAAADFRSSQPSWAKVFDVGFRVVCEDDAE